MFLWPHIQCVFTSVHRRVFICFTSLIQNNHVHQHGLILEDYLGPQLHREGHEIPSFSIFVGLLYFVYFSKQSFPCCARLLVCGPTPLITLICSTCVNPVLLSVWRSSLEFISSSDLILPEPCCVSFCRSGLKFVLVDVVHLCCSSLPAAGSILSRFTVVKTTVWVAGVCVLLWTLFVCLCPVWLCVLWWTVCVHFCEHVWIFCEIFFTCLHFEVNKWKIEILKQH